MKPPTETTAMTTSPTPMTSDVLVLGSSISALMSAAWLRRSDPSLSVTVLGPPVGAEKRPVVGESTVEPAILFFRALGLDPYLDQRHELKNGLTFYHKLAPKQPEDRRYTVHMPMAPLLHTACQLHRPAFDIELGRVAAELGVRFVHGRARDIALGQGQGQGNHKDTEHRVEATLDAGGEASLRARFVIDATGRSRVLGRKVTRYAKPSAQRSAFWFRIQNFEALLPKLELSWRRPAEYELWKSTHHFMGENNWIWGIPMRDEQGEAVLSMGITWRPDLVDHGIRTLDDFLAHVEGEHPAIAELVHSGEVLDTNSYRNYLYKAEQVYSDEGWFLVGDAARSVDPLYSTGLSMTVIQIEQIAEIIRRRRGAGITAAQIAELEGLWTAIAEVRQTDIADQYETMSDPFQACMRRYWNLSGWFNGVLPLWYAGYFNDPEAATILRRMLAKGRPATHAAWRLFAATARTLGEVEQADFDRTTDFDWMINRAFDRPVSEVGAQVGAMLQKRAHLRLNLIRLGGWRELPSQARYLARELALAKLVPLAFARNPALHRGEHAQEQEQGPATTWVGAWQPT